MPAGREAEWPACLTSCQVWAVLPPDIDAPTLGLFSANSERAWDVHG
jgi:hypothetical protein